MGSERTGVQSGSAEPDEPVSLRIERAHRRILEVFDRQPKEAGELAQTRALLDTLPRMLTEHFAEEEGLEGLFEAMRAARPAIDPQLKFLCREHREILEAIETLERRVRELEAGLEPERRELLLARLRENVDALVGRIRRHEQAESRLVADVFYDEEGGSG